MRERYKYGGRMNIATFAKIHDDSKENLRMSKNASAFRIVSLNKKLVSDLESRAIKIFPGVRAEGPRLPSS